MNVSPSPTKPSSVCRRTQMMLGNSPRRMVSSCVIFMACLSDVGNVLSTPAQYQRVQAARRLDQAGPGGRVQGRKRMTRGIAGDHAALFHQHLAGQWAALAILIIDQGQPARVSTHSLFAAP